MTQDNKQQENKPQENKSHVQGNQQFNKPTNSSESNSVKQADTHQNSQKISEPDDLKKDHTKDEPMKSSSSPGFSTHSSEQGNQRK